MSVETLMKVHYSIGIAAQHSQSLEAWFYHVPGLKAVMPATSYDVKGLLKNAVRDNNPVVFIEHKMIYLNKCPVPEEEVLLQTFVLR